MSLTGETPSRGKDRGNKRDTYIDCFENAPVAVHLLDSSGVVLHANAACLELFGVTAAQFIGKPLAGFLVDTDEAGAILAQLSTGAEIRARALTINGPRAVLLQANACFDDGEFQYARLFLSNLGDHTLTDSDTQLKHDVLKVLAESSIVVDAIEAIVPIMAQVLCCDIALAWRADDKSNRLDRLVLWRGDPHEDAKIFLSKSNNISLDLSGGFPATYWFSDRAHVIKVGTTDSNETSKAMMCLGSEMAECLPQYKQIVSVPIAIGRLNWGLLGFFGQRETTISASLLSLLESLGREIGRFVERQNAFENYQKLQESYSLAIAGANDGIWDWDFKTNEAYFSPRWKSLLGFEDHELENHFDTFRALTHPDDYPKVMDAVQKHMETREPYDEQIRMRSKTGDYIWISTRGQCSYDGKGQPIRMSGSHRDITELKLAELARKRSEDKLLESEANFRQLAENIREVAWIMSADRSRFFYISPAFEEFWHLPCQDLHNDADLFFAGMDDSDRIRVLQLIESGDVDDSGLEFEFRLKKSAPGKQRWMWARMFPINDADGNPERYCGIAHDITNKKEIEKHANEFYSTISHELRTPLTSIRAALGLIEGGLTGDIPRETLDYTSIARDNCDRLIRLISDMLDIKKIEANHLELHLSRLNPAEIVQVTVESVRPYAEQSGVILKVVPSKARDCLGDRDRVIQVMTNLLSNAIKYTPPGKTVTVTAENGSGGGMGRHTGNISFSVRDQGPGIAESDKIDLFGPFQQLSCVENEVNRGTGLGLAISKVLVEKQNGTIGVNSRLGDGSEFWFELPPYTPEKAGVSGLESNSYSPDKPKILLLEDSESIAMILTAVLSKNGYYVVRAATIAGAQALLEEGQPPGIIIADVNLPDGSGLNFINFLQTQAQTQINQSAGATVIPAIILSGSTPDPGAIVNKQSVDWVRKPFDNNKLLSLIKKRILSSPSASEQHQH